MNRQALLLALSALTVAAVAMNRPAWSQTPTSAWSVPGEEAVDPYTVSNANAGAAPMIDTAAFEAFHGKAGVDRVVDDLVERSFTDPRTKDIFVAFDKVRIKRTLGEQICFVLGGGCAYSGRDMAAAHKDMGLVNADVNALVENLQLAMDKEGVSFGVQNRLLARLAPMKRQMVAR